MGEEELSNNKPDAKETDAKILKWKQIEQEVDSITDALGKHIDGGIRDAVIALKANQINTVGSCEGHAERRIPSPWIDVEGVDTPESLQAKQILPELDEKINDIETEDSEAAELNDLYTRRHEAYYEAILPQLQEVEKVIQLLDKFYATRAVSEDRRLIINAIDNMGRIESQGSRIQAIRSDTDKQKKLDEYKEEMKLFADFLKNMFFQNTD